jgi:hypothetical protein
MLDWPGVGTLLTAGPAVTNCFSSIAGSLIGQLSLKLPALSLVSVVSSTAAPLFTGRTVATAGLNFAQHQHTTRADRITNHVNQEAHYENTKS